MPKSKRTPRATISRTEAGRKAPADSTSNPNSTSVSQCRPEITTIHISHTKRLMDTNTNITSSSTAFVCTIHIQTRNDFFCERNFDPRWHDILSGSSKKSSAKSPKSPKVGGPVWSEMMHVVNLRRIGTCVDTQGVVRAPIHEVVQKQPPTQVKLNEATSHTRECTHTRARAHTHTHTHTHTPAHARTHSGLKRTPCKG